ncbi:MAG: hypothetical protein ACLTST_01205 [Lachnospiraceae bacterium]
MRALPSSGHRQPTNCLDINAIKASFVLTEYNGRIYVSARSIDEVNVQIIMERLGGGEPYERHPAHSLIIRTWTEAVTALRESLTKWSEGGDI